jgi:hypothetical protein
VGSGKQHKHVKYHEQERTSQGTMEIELDDAHRGRQEGVGLFWGLSLTPGPAAAHQQAEKLFAALLLDHIRAGEVAKLVKNHEGAPANHTKKRTERKDD